MVDNISKPFTFTANTYAKASEVNADFDTLYTGVNACVNQINANIADINNLDSDKADINGNSTQRFSVADPTVNTDAVNKQSLMKYISNSLDYISGLVVSKDSSSPNDTIIVSPGSCYDSTKNVMLSLQNNTTKQNENQGPSVTYYVYIIGNSTGSSVDILISPNQVTPTLPTGYSLYRQIGSYTTNNDNSIDVINYYGHNSTAPQGIATIVETYVNGASWYRVWSDGWIEQGGLTASYDTLPTTIALLKNYSNTNYSVQCTQVGSNIRAYTMGVTDKTTSGFKVYSGYCTNEGVSNTAGNSRTCWYACGY